MKIAVLGDCFVDVVVSGLRSLPQWGEDRKSPHPIEIQPGGSALNTATHLAHLSETSPQIAFEVSLFSAVGRDQYAILLERHLRDHGVRPSLTQLAPPTKTGVCMVLSCEADRSFITYYGASEQFESQHIDEEKLLQSQHIHIAGFYSCRSLQTNLVPLMKKAKRLGVTLSMDTNYDSSNQWTGLDDIFPLLDAFFPNELEAKKISKQEDTEQILAYFSARIPLTVMTRGDKGAIAITSEGQVIQQDGYHQMKVIDPTGAGDAFNAGFLFAWKKQTENGDQQRMQAGVLDLVAIKDGLKWGCAVAAKTIENVGASSNPSSFDQIQQITSILK